MPTRKVIHRPDRVVQDAQQLLVRFGQDTDVAQALRLALIDRLAPLPRRPGVRGARRDLPTCVSAFLVESESDAQRMLEDVVWAHYGLSTAGAIRAVGYVVIGTDMEEDGELIPFSERHADVVVAAYPSRDLAICRPRPVVVGETVLVADGEGQPFEAKIERIDPDGTIVLTVLAFAA